MKKSLIAAMLFFATSTLALAATPNTFTCSGVFGDKDFSLTYGNPNKSGLEVLALNFNSDPAQRFVQTDMNILKSTNIFGNVVGMIVETQLGVFESWSMVVPKISMRSVYNKVLYDALVIRAVEVNASGTAPGYLETSAYLSNLKYINVRCLAALHVY